MSPKKSRISNEKREEQLGETEMGVPTGESYVPKKLQLNKGLIPFNSWSKERIRQGRKKCTSRTKVYNDDRVICVVPLPWGVIKRYLWKEEGADSPEELQSVINKIHRRFVPETKTLYVHFGDFSDEVQ